VVDAPTKWIADEVISGLSLHLSSLATESLPSAGWVLITGSYTREDWLDCNSDLGIDVLDRDDDPDSATWRRRTGPAWRT
jgi:hypothetical protein